MREGGKEMRTSVGLLVVVTLAIVLAPAAAVAGEGTIGAQYRVNVMQAGTDLPSTTGHYVLLADEYTNMTDIPGRGMSPVGPFIVVQTPTCWAMESIPEATFRLNMQRAELDVDSSCGRVVVSVRRTGPIDTTVVEEWRGSLENCSGDGGHLVSKEQEAPAAGTIRIGSSEFTVPARLVRYSDVSVMCQ